MDLKNFYADAESTFEFDDSLPSLPVPVLSETLKLYLESVRPHVTDDEFDETNALVAAFEKEDGPMLQQHLVDRSIKLKNWMEGWWESAAYLSQRSPLIPCSNLCGIFPLSEPLWAPDSFGQVPRAALITYFLLQYWKLLRSERLRPDQPRGERWSMAQFRRCFSTVRIPGENIDKLVSRFVTESEGPPASLYIVVLCRGHLYKMVVLDSHCEPYSPSTLRDQFEFIQQDCSVDNRGPGVASLTYGERTQWARDRLYLINSNAVNEDYLNVVENAIMFVSLDDSSPVTDAEILKMAVGGEIGCRWADSLTVTIFKNGTTASNGDHTPYDGMVGISMNVFVHLNFMDWHGDWQTDDTSSEFPTPIRINFVLDDYCRKAIDSAIASTSKLLDAMSCQVVQFEAFGKKLITSRKINPDTFVQLALQLAYYRSHNKCAPTYETATTRRFYNGRTETLRSCTVESTAWVKAMLSSSSKSSEHWTLFETAIARHNHLMKMGKNNEGCDRHLLGLYLTAVEQNLPIPKIFNDPSWTKSGGDGNFILSTSLTGYTLTSGAVMPMCTDGYGVFYSISSEGIRFNVTAWRTSAETDAVLLCSNIRKSLLDMEALFVSAKL